ncbi:hypothetical protein [Legionella feeleii]|uniref:Dot/Icm secretion system substrate n=1 Tax=Legionella feeleii TaxID=453 RepID=A0A0W0TNQ3_9GAMM|nr:hypothetical protein [Legionella feeleii]KTC97180.1 hypothetical protein Lfee_1534 [Legionella feeleii]SPX59287.1 Uncharacterised protein [Legionella feeleii]
MPQVRKITGNHPHVVRSVFKSKYFPDSRSRSGRMLNVAEEILKTSSYIENVDNIFKDLPRNPFLPSGGKTGEDYVRDWSNTFSYDYAQGNLTAGLYHFLLDGFMTSPDFFKEDTGRDPKDFAAYIRSIKKVDFAYYNDNGIPCGISISYSSKDPSLWLATIIRNTTGKPEDRETLFLSAEEFIRNDNEDKQKELVESDSFAEEFLEFSQSKTVAALFEGTLLANGQVNALKLEELAQSLKEMDLNNISHNKVFQARKKHFDQQKQLHVQALADIKNPALESAAQQSYARRNAGPLFSGFLVFGTLVNLVLIATGFLAPFGLFLEGIKNYLAFGVAAVIGVVSAAKLAINEQQLSTYQASLERVEQDLEKENRAAFLLMDNNEPEEALIEHQALVPDTGEVQEDDSNGFAVVGGLVDEVVHGDDSLFPKATHLIDSVQLPVDIFSRKDVGVVVTRKEDGIVIPTNDGTLIYS